MPSTGILSLPHEILGHISAFYVDSNRTDSRGTPTYRWFLIAHICIKWREAALGTPQLWTEIIPGHSAECLDAVLARAGPVLPLTLPTSHSGVCIFYDPLDSKPTYQPGRLAALGFVYNQMPRLSFLHIDLMQTENENYHHILHFLHALENSGIRDAPRLEELTIWNYLDDPTALDTLNGGLPLLSAAVLPNLKELTVVCCEGIWPLTASLLRQTLTKLSLFIDTFDVPVVLDILCQLPVLEELHLGGVEFAEDNDNDNDLYPYGALPHVPDSDRIVLPRLRSINVGDPGQGRAALRFLGFLRLPSCTQIHVTARSLLMSADLVYLTKMVIRKAKENMTSDDAGKDTVTRQGQPLREFTSLAVACGTFELELSLHTRTTACACVGAHRCGCAISVIATYPYRATHPSLYVHALLSVLGVSLRSIEKLHVHGMALGKDTWKLILQRTPELERVVLRGKHEPYGFLDAVESILDEGASREEAEVGLLSTRDREWRRVLPKLRHIAIRWAEWGPCTSEPEDTDDDDDDDDEEMRRPPDVYFPQASYRGEEPLSRLLIRVLKKWRAVGGCEGGKLACLEVDQVRINAAAYEELAEVVKEVRVNDERQ